MPAERLQKIIAAAGIASRRKAEELITQGRVSVNGAIVSTLGAKADIENDHIKVDGKAVHLPEHNVYLLLHKPKGYVTTVSDPEGRPTVMELVRSKARLFPVGRLDWNTEGLLLLTNDGDLTAKLTHASTHVPKTYLVKVAGNPTLAEIEKLRDGVMIGGEGDPVPGKLHRVKTAPAKIREVREGDNPWYEVTLIEGRNRQIRRMFEAIGHHVEKIKRVRYGPLELDVPPGESRPLRPHEIEKLKSYVSEPATAAREQRGGKHAAGERGAPVPNVAGLPPAKRFGKSQNFRFRAGAGRVGGRPARPEFERGERGATGSRPSRPFGGDRPPRGDWPPRGDRPQRFERTMRADHVEREGRPGGVKRFGADGVETPFEHRPSSSKPFKKPFDRSGGKRFGKPFEKRGAGDRPFRSDRAAAGAPGGGPTKRFSRPPRREFGGPPSSDRPPRREFGGSPRGDRPFSGPRREGGAGRPFGGPRGEGGPKRFGAKPFGGPRGDRPLSGPRREGGAGRPFGGPRREGGPPKRFGAKSFGGPRREGTARKSFSAPRSESGGPKRFGAKPFGGPRREGAAGKSFGGPKRFGAKQPFGGPKRFDGKKPFGARSSSGPKRGFGSGGRFGGASGRGRTGRPPGDRG